MYLGIENEAIPLWRERWIDSPFGRGGRMESYRAGTTTRELHVYQCACGRISKVIGRAEERFFCGACNQLINIE